MGTYSCRDGFMSHGRACALSTWGTAIVLALSADAQSVISTHSGVIHFFEGTVYLGDQPLEPHLGRFPTVPQDAELRTAEGRAEVLLTPGVFLRMGERSAIRMLANDLADTRVELESGSAIVDSAEPNSGTSVTLIYKTWRIHFLQKGIYRIDSDPPRVAVREGEAEVFAASNPRPVSVERGMTLPFASVLVPEQASGRLGDAFSDWATGRGQSISADNAITAQIDEDPDSRTPGLDSFTYFPYLGLSSLGLSSPSPYSSFALYQPGFSSIYLPGYTYRPLLLGLPGLGLRTYLPTTTRRIGGSPGIGGIVPIRPLPRPVLIRPATPVGVHGGAHR
jgi:hypothetical protein